MRACALLGEPAHLALRRLEPAEAVAAMHEVDRPRGGALQVDRPVERGVAAADDHAALVGELGLALDEVVQPAPAPGLEPLDRQRARLEGPVAGGDDQRAAEVVAALVGREAPDLLAFVLDPLELAHVLAEVHVAAVLQRPARPCGRRTPGRSPWGSRRCRRCASRGTRPPPGHRAARGSRRCGTIASRCPT